LLEKIIFLAFDTTTTTGRGCQWPTTPVTENNEMREKVRAKMRFNVVG
jgi:hypothetical protein